MDSCNGYSHYWSDDSYSSGHYPCPGPERCPTSRLPPKVVPLPEGPRNPLDPPVRRLPRWDDPPTPRGAA